MSKTIEEWKVSIMARIYSDFKKLSNKKKTMVYSLLVLFGLILIAGIKSAYAYYHGNDSSFSILAAVVGDFDLGKLDADVNMMIYKEVESEILTDEKSFVRTYGVPSIGYKFDSNLTRCSNHVTREEVECYDEASETGTKTGTCHYKYNEDGQTFSLTSTQKVTCKFYFTQTMSSDIDVNIYIEDEQVRDKVINDKGYKLVNDIPTEGFEYDKENSKCHLKGDTGSELQDALKYEGGKFTVTSTGKTVCEAYFNKNDEVADEPEIEAPSYDSEENVESPSFDDVESSETEEPGIE